MSAVLTRERTEVPAGEAAKPAPRQSVRSRGRAAVLWGVGLFVLSQGMLRLGIELWQPELRDPLFEMRYRQLGNRLAHSPGPPVRVIFFGSSITAQGVKAGSVEESLTRAVGRPVVAYNLGIPGCGPFGQMVALRRLLDRGVRPDLAVIELTPLVHDTGDRLSDLALFEASAIAHHELALVQRYAPDPELTPQWWQTY